MIFQFPGQRPDENVLMVIRKHPIVHFKIILIFLMTIILPLFLFMLFWVRQYPFGEYQTPGLVVGIFASLYILYGLLFSCVAWINEEFDVCILTDQRFMDITQISLFRRSVTSTPLERIQDATSSVDGFFQTLLNYGNILIQTAGGNTNIHIFIDKTPLPGDTARRIMDAVNAQREKFRGNAEPNPV